MLQTQSEQPAPPRFVFTEALSAGYARRTMTTISNSASSSDEIASLLKRLVAAAERISPPPPGPPDLAIADAFVFDAAGPALQPVARVNRVALPLLVGIDRSRDTLLDNTRRFADGLPANNALLWGARGMGKSSLVKAVHAEINMSAATPLKLVEIHREDIESLPRLMGLLRSVPFRIVIFCDDLSFDPGDSSYKSLKAVLDGGIEGRPENILFYATSNRRHLMPRDMMDNERATAINPGEAIEEKVSLSDRFGLWLGFHKCTQDEYLAMVDGYARHFGLRLPAERLHAEALEWSTTRGSRAGRVAWQFICDLAGRLGQRLETGTEASQ